MSGTCVDCSKSTDVTYTPHGWVCASCLFNLVSHSNYSVVDDDDEPSRRCSECGDVDSYMLCSGCNTKYCDNCGEEAGSYYCWSCDGDRISRDDVVNECDVCGDDDQVFCYDHAKEEWGLVDPENQPLFAVPAITAEVSSDGEISVDGVAIQWN